MKYLFTSFLFLTVGLSVLIAQTPISKEEIKAQLQANGINVPASELGKVTEAANNIATQKVNSAAVLTTKKAATEVNQSIDQKVQEGLQAGKTEKEAVVDAVQEVKKETPLPQSTIYGHHLYRQRNITAISDGVNVRAPDSYILGTGDELSINVWGHAEYSGAFKINDEGYIKPDRMPRLYLKGLTYKQAKEKLSSLFRQSYNLTTSDLAVSLNYSRTITVNVVGEVMQPRSYTISAINTAVNALAAADGPTDIGSVRSIRVSSSGKPDRTLDLYKFLLNPLSSEDFFIGNNDYLFVPPIGKVIEVQGAVKRPFKYELLPNENLKSLLQWCGGINSNAYQGSVQIRRFENDQTKIININLADTDKNSGDFGLRDGDLIVVASIDGGFVESTKLVQIKGAVAKPNTYNLLLNEGLRTLIGKAGGLLANTYTGNLQVQRTENNEVRLYDVSLKQLDSLKADFPLKKGDIITINTIDPDYFTNFGSIEGAVKLPGRYEIEAGKTRISDFLKKAELKDDANTPLIYLSRLQSDLSRLYYRISLDAILKSTSSGDNMVMQSKDELFILSKSAFRESYGISVGGSVRNPGEQKLTVNTNLRDAIFRAGGLTIEADHGKIELSRVIISKGEAVRTIVRTIAIEDTLYIKNDSIGNIKLQAFDQIMVRRLPGFGLQRFVTISGEVKYPGSYAIINNKERISDLVKRAGGLLETAEAKDANMKRGFDDVGFVVLDLDDALKRTNSTYNYLLKPGDNLTIPRARELVSVEGAVAYPTIDSVRRVSMAYQPGRSLQYYVNEYAGGLNKEKRGSFDYTTIHYPNGAVSKSKRRFLFFYTYPEVKAGCVITVGTRPLPKKEEEKENKDNKIDAEKILESSMKVFQFAVSALTVILLANQLNK